MVNDSGYPSNWMADVQRLLPKQVVNVCRPGRRCEMKENTDELADSAIRLRIVLLIACANVANLLLARGVARRGQIAVRMAVARREARLSSRRLPRAFCWRLRAIAGLVVAVAAARLLLALAFHSAHFLPISTRPSLLVLAFAFALALVTGIIFGAAPAWFATRPDPVDALRGSVAARAIVFCRT